LRRASGTGPVADAFLIAFQLGQRRQAVVSEGRVERGRWCRLGCACARPEARWPAAAFMARKKTVLGTSARH